MTFAAATRERRDKRRANPSAGDDWGAGASVIM
jgi:hypothetical protein